MKILKSLLVLSLVSVITFIGCKKEDSQQSNHIVYKGVEYPMDKALLIEEGNSSRADVYGVGFGLLSPEIKVDYDGNVPDSLYGTGNFVFFDMLTSNANGLDIGKYSIDTSSTNAPFKIELSFAAFNTDINDTIDLGDALVGVQGDFDVLQNGDTYEISFSATFLNFSDPLNPQVITGYYKGSPIKATSEVKK